MKKTTKNRTEGIRNSVVQRKMLKTKQYPDCHRHRGTRATDTTATQSLASRKTRCSVRMRKAGTHLQKLRSKHFIATALAKAPRYPAIILVLIAKGRLEDGKCTFFTNHEEEMNRSVFDYLIDSKNLMTKLSLFQISEPVSEFLSLRK